MPDFENLNLQELLPWLISSAGMLFYATYASIALKHLRDPRDDSNFSPLVQKVSWWVQDLSPIDMQMFSFAVYFIPLTITYLVVYYVPVEWIVLLQPHIAAIITAILIYTGQQWVYRGSKKPVVDEEQ